MNFPRCCAFVFLFICVSSICKTQSFDFDACPSGENDKLHLTYGKLSVECYTKYDLGSVTAAPKITFPHADKDKFYEILMIDPDAPSAGNPRCRSWLHMVLSNVKGSDLQNGVFADNRDSGLEVITAYKAPTPPEGTGYHRYILAAFSHAEKLNVPDVKNRCRFDIDAFTGDHNLDVKPDASMMFETITKL